MVGKLVDVPATWGSTGSSQVINPVRVSDHPPHLTVFLPEGDWREWMVWLAEGRCRYTVARRMRFERLAYRTRWVEVGTVFRFEEHADAVLFKMTFGMTGTDGNG